MRHAQPWITLPLHIVFSIAIIAFSTQLCLASRPVTVEDYVKLHKILTDQTKGEFSWMVFALISRSMSPQHLALKKHNVLWETWADNAATFPARPDPSHPPVWPTPSRQSSSRKHLSPNPIAPPHIIDGTLIEVRRNRPSFESIIKQQLWYVEGLDCAYNAGINNYGILKSAILDGGSVEVKAAWAPSLDVAHDAKHFYINYDSHNKPYKLIGLHVMTNALDLWTWSTFEQIDQTTCGTEGDCENQEPASTSVPPPPRIASLLYTENPIWRNYRLVDTQIGYMAPEYLGNATLEKGIQKTSCIGCHAGARFLDNHSWTPIFVDPSDPSQLKQIDGVSLHGVSLQGGPAPFTPSKPPAGPFRPLGFLWSVPLHARSLPDGVRNPPCFVPISHH